MDGGFGGVSSSTKPSTTTIGNAEISQKRENLGMIKKKERELRKRKKWERKIHEIFDRNEKRDKGKSWRHKKIIHVLLG